ncbi:phage tail tape measure protein [Paenibacillus sp. TRM 82003]|nr:phage tail tape measure protein [Paenibacillus sp. TRM 82003]
MKKLFSLFGEILIENESANKAMDDVDKKGEKAQGKLDGLISTAAGFAAGLAAVGAAAVAALGVKAVTAADDFNKAMNGLAAETGATSEEIAEFEDIATRIYNNNFGESFDDIANSMAEVRKTTGLTGQALEEATTSALMLRDTFEYDVNQSIGTVNTLMENFGITADEAYTLIAQGAQNGADKNGDLLDTLNEYSPQFKALGFDAEQFTNVLIDGAQNGAWSIDKVGDAIKEFTIRSKDLSDSSLEAFESLGLNGQEMSAQFASGGTAAQTAFQQVMDALAGVEDPLEQNRIGVALFGTQFEDLEADAVLALGNVGSNADMTADTLGQINEVKYDSFGEALQGIGRNLETSVLIPLGEKVLPVLEDFATWIMDNMPQIQSFFEGAMDGAGSAVDGLGKAFTWLKDEIITPVMEFVVPLVQESVEGITAYWDENGEEIMTTVETVFGWIQKTVEEVMPIVQSVVETAVETIGSVLESIGDIVMGIIKVLDGIFTGDWQKVWEGASEIVGGIFDGLVATVKGALNLIITGVNSLIRGLNRIKVSVPDWVPGEAGGKSFGINIKELPMLAEGGNIVKRGSVIVGEAGPEILDLPEAARVRPLSESDYGGYREATIHMYMDSTEVAKKIRVPLTNMIRLQTGLR